MTIVIYNPQSAWGFCHDGWRGRENSEELSVCPTTIADA